LKHLYMFGNLKFCTPWIDILENLQAFSVKVLGMKVARTTGSHLSQYLTGV
jgi:hypothetical protein